MYSSLFLSARYRYQVRFRHCSAPSIEDIVRQRARIAGKIRSAVGPLNRHRILAIGMPSSVFSADGATQKRVCGVLLTNEY